MLIHLPWYVQCPHISLVCGFLLLTGGRRGCDADQTLLAQVRALEQWDEEGAPTQIGLGVARGANSQQKLVYRAILIKYGFLKKIVDGDEEMVISKSDMDSAEEQAGDAQEEKKKAKQNCNAAKEAIGALISQTLEKKEEVDAEINALSKIVEERKQQGEDDGFDAGPQLAEIEVQIADKQQALQGQEGTMQDLGNEKQQWEVTERSLREKIETSKPGPGPNYREKKNRQMAAWYRSANKALGSLANVASVRQPGCDAEVPALSLPLSRFHSRKVRVQCRERCGG